MEESGVYEVCIIERPTAEALKAGAAAKLILAPTPVIANGRSAALPHGVEAHQGRLDPQRITRWSAASVGTRVACGYARTRGSRRGMDAPLSTQTMTIQSYADS
jgi:hypothetical protein